MPLHWMMLNCFIGHLVSFWCLCGKHQVIDIYCVPVLTSLYGMSKKSIKIRTSVCVTCAMLCLCLLCARAVFVVCVHSLCCVCAVINIISTSIYVSYLVKWYKYAHLLCFTRRAFSLILYRVILRLTKIDLSWWLINLWWQHALWTSSFRTTQSSPANARGLNTHQACAARLWRSSPVHLRPSWMTCPMTVLQPCSAISTSPGSIHRAYSPVSAVRASLASSAMHQLQDLHKRNLRLTVEFRSNTSCCLWRPSSSFSRFYLFEGLHGNSVFVCYKL